MASNNFINPEYKVTNDAQYLPYKHKVAGVKKNSKLAVVRNLDGSNGVSLYDDSELIVQTNFSENVDVDYVRETRKLNITVNNTPDPSGAVSTSSGRIVSGNGIRVTRRFDTLDENTDTKVISLDETYTRNFVNNNINLRGKNGVIVEREDNDVENGKVVYLDDNYTIEQGEY